MLGFAGLLLGTAVATQALTLQCVPSAFDAILPNGASINFAHEIEHNGTFDVPEDDIAYPISPTNLPKTCAVEINVMSSATSSFTFGLFLPENWNHRFLMVGNGGFAGGVNWLDMGAGLGYGFAVASTNTGHNSTSDDIEWALNQPEKKIDFGYRAMHGSIEMAKFVVNASYGSRPDFSYYSGCSTGGRQGLVEAERYPDDFDGILAGAPAWWTAHLQTWTVKLGLFNLPTNAPHHISLELFPVIEAEVLKQCDPQDGVVDNIISDPHHCNFNAEALLCSHISQQHKSESHTLDCLTPAQLGTLSNIYSSYVETNDTLVFPGLSLGSESQWPVLIGGTEPNALGIQYVQYMLLNDPEWNFFDFNYTIVELADKLDPGNSTANDFDLLPFSQKGGKLLMYHGHADGLISTGSSIYFYKKVLQALVPQGIDVDKFLRFFLVPGMQHCGGTSEKVNAPWYFAGANQAGDLGTYLHSVPGFSDKRHDALMALMAWVEEDNEPEMIIATKWHNDTLQDKVLRQRPLCPYPKQAKYTGHGDMDDANSWNCVGYGQLYQQIKQKSLAEYKVV